MFFNRKKRILNNLEASFGEFKTEGFNFDLIKRYFLNSDLSVNQSVLTDQTADDLDFDLFFTHVDRTTSKIGQQYLYAKMRMVESTPRKFDNQEKVINYLENHTKERLKIQYQLQKLNHQQAYYLVDLFQEEIEKRPNWYYLFPMLSVVSFCSLFLTFLHPKFLILFLIFFGVNTIIHFGLKKKTNVFINSIPGLLTLGAIAKKLWKMDILKKIDSDLGVSLNVITSIRRKMSFFKLEQKVDSDIEVAYWYLLELIKITFLLEPLLLFSSLDVLRNKAKEIERVFRFVGEVDTIVSIASLRSGLEEYCLPILKETGNVRFEEMLHPLVPNCVPNEVNFERSVLLTGSNMSGKTTYIRAIGLNTISGKTINTCFAKSAMLPMAQLFSVIRIEDDLIHSSSYFFKEVDEMKKIIERTNESIFSIVLLDELFKGTNTFERVASAKATLSFLSKRNCQVFVSTHDIELTVMLKDEFDLLHFSEYVSENEIHFDYKLKYGIPEKGNAIRILEISGYPKEIIHEAQFQLTRMT